MPARIVTAAYRHLMASGIPQQLQDEGLLGGDEPDDAFPLWVFAGDLTGDPFRAVEGTGTCAIVVYSFDHWSPQSREHTMRYPRLYLVIYADRTRDQEGNPFGPHDAEDKVETIYRRISPLFHDPANRIRAFDQLRIISTTEGGALSIMDIPEGDGSVRGLVSYEVTTD